jgi:hypothetical protein
MQQGLGQCDDLWRHGGREQPGLPLVWQGGDDPANVTNEAEIEHTVSLVEHELADLVQFLAGGHEVADTAWRADNDIGTATHALHLHEAADAAQDGDNVQRLLVGKAAQTVLDLQCQLTRWRQDESACREMGRKHGSGCQVLQQRPGERGGFAGSCLGDTEQIATRQKRRDGACLDGVGSTRRSLASARINNSVRPRSAKVLSGTKSMLRRPPMMMCWQKWAPWYSPAPRDNGANALTKFSGRACRPEPDDHAIMEVELISRGWRRKRGLAAIWHDGTAAMSP